MKDKIKIKFTECLAVENTIQQLATVNIVSIFVQFSMHILKYVCILYASIHILNKNSNTVFSDFFSIASSIKSFRFHILHPSLHSN